MATSKRLPLLVVSVLLGTTSCKPVVATAVECDAAAMHLAELQVKKEKKPPHGRLAIAPFNTKEHEKDVFDEARDSAKARCTKGWKREVYDCMMKAQEIEEADKCRFL